jgi:hypothetical protein
MGIYSGTYLMSGILDADEKIVDKTLFPLCNTLVAIGEGSDFAIRMSNLKGLLCHIGVVDNKIVPLSQAHFKDDQIESKHSDTFIMIYPSEVLQDAWFVNFAAGEDGDEIALLKYLRSWAVEYHANVKDKVKVSIQQFKKENLSEISGASENDEYRGFYTNFEGPGYCCLVPRIRSILIKCHSNIFKTTLTEPPRVKILAPFDNKQSYTIALQNEESDQGSQGKGFVGVLWGTAKNIPSGYSTLPSGRYSVEIAVDQLNQNSPYSFTKPYIFSTCLDFHYRSAGIETGVITIDPISLEEALLSQFPTRNIPIVKAIIEGNREAEEAEEDKGESGEKESSSTEIVNNKEEKEGGKKEGEDEKKLKPSKYEIVETFKTWFERAKWTKEQYEAGQVFLEPGNGFKKFKSVMQFLIKHRDKGNTPDWIESTYNLVVGPADFALTYCKFLKKEEHAKLIAQGFHALGANGIGDLAIKDFIRLNESFEFDDAKLKQATNLMKSNWNKKSLELKVRLEENAIFKKTKDDFLKSKSKEVHELFEEFKSPKTKALRKAEMIKGAAAGYVDAIQSAIVLYLDTAELFETMKKSDQWRADLHASVKGYIDLCGHGFSREGMAVMEKFRIALLAARGNVSAAMLKEIEAIFNFTLAACALIPPLSLPAGLILLGKEAIESAIETVHKVTEALDDTILFHSLSMMKENTERVDSIITSSGYNASEIAKVDGNGPEHDAVRQLFVRAEVLNGLMKLIEMAGAKVGIQLSEDGKHFDVGVRKRFEKHLFDEFRIDEYIDTFIFGKAGPWVYPNCPRFPLPFDTFWLHFLPEKKSTQSGSSNTFHDALRNQYGKEFIKSYIKHPILTPLFYGPLGDIEKPLDSFEVNFQDRFPIHYLENGNSREGILKICRSFSLNYSLLPPNFIEDIFVYYWDDVGAKNWVPIWNETNGEIQPVTPLTPIRICVICKPLKNPDECTAFPISIKLHRSGYLYSDDCDGPVYNLVTKKLVPQKSEGLLTDGPGLMYEQPYHNEGRQGVVFHPFFAFAGLIRRGLKPFQSDFHGYAERVNRISIHVGIEGSLCKAVFAPPAKPPALGQPRKRNISNFGFFREIPVVFKLTKTNNDPEEDREVQLAMAQDGAFITNRTQNKTSQPALLEMKKEFAILGIFQKSSSGWTFHQRDDKNGVAVLPGIWGKPFEMAVVVGLSGINDVLKKSTDHNWRRVPLCLKWHHAIPIVKSGSLMDLIAPIPVIQEKLVEAIGDRNYDGPTYRAPFYFAGYTKPPHDISEKFAIKKLEKGLITTTEGGHLKADEVPDIDHIDSHPVSEVIDLLKNKDFFDFMQTYTPWIYVGYFRFNYEMPDRRWIDGLRPFGNRKNLLNNSWCNFHFKISDEMAANGHFAFSNSHDEFKMSMPSPLSQYEPLPKGVTKEALTEEFLDQGKICSSYVGIDAAIAKVMEEGGSGEE